MPTPNCAERAMKEPPIAPLCEMIEMLPLGGAVSSVATRLPCVQTIPAQFGPMKRMPWRFAVAIISFSPSAFPASEKPELIIMAAFTPHLPQSSRIPLTVTAGAAITAMSTFSGTSFSEAQPFAVRTEIAFGFTAKTRSMPPSSRRLINTFASLPSLAEPKTATALG